MNKINFCIIAHIDHGKSTLADRFLELTHTVTSRNMKDQVLDQMDLEREKGITIKLQPVTMHWKGYQLNLIDTPGHVDFSYEVSRSLAAVEGAVLLVDATQGIQAQTLANLYLALEQNLTIIPVINKIDAPTADEKKVTAEIVNILGCKPDEIIAISAKTGQNIELLLDEVIKQIKPVEVHDRPTRALVFDSKYDEYKGIVTYVRIFEGSLKAGQTITFLAQNLKAQIIEVGVFKPQMLKQDKLESGDIGYLITNVKNIENTKVGDTVTTDDPSTVKPLAGYRDVKPMVYAGIFPEEGNEFNKFRDALLKLKLNDSSLTYEPENSPVLGFGFRCGFLGLLHLEIFQERLIREFGIPTVVTTPSVAYKVHLTSRETKIITAPVAFPEPQNIDFVEEPVVELSLVTPKNYMGNLMNYLSEHSAELLGTDFIDETRVILNYKLPLSSILTDFYDKIKNMSSGYASYSYILAGYQPCDVVKLDILVAEDLVPSLTSIAYRDKVQEVGKRFVKALKEVIPKKQFVIKIQAAVGGKIVAAERISALRKDVTAKLYGGDVTRKRKLLEKQKKGKKKMMQAGKVEIPQKAFLAILKK